MSNTVFVSRDTPGPSVNVQNFPFGQRTYQERPVSLESVKLHSQCGMAVTCFFPWNPGSDPVAAIQLANLPPVLDKMDEVVHQFGYSAQLATLVTPQQDGSIALLKDRGWVEFLRFDNARSGNRVVCLYRVVPDPLKGVSGIS